MAHNVKVVDPSPTPATPLPTTIGAVEAEVRELRAELGRETSVEKMELILHRIDLLEHKRKALLLVEENTTRQHAEAEAAAAARAAREAQRQAKGLTLAQVRERIAQREQEQRDLLAEVDVIQRDADRLAEQGRRECQGIPSVLIWESADGAILRARRDKVDQRRYAVACELSVLRPMLEPEEVPHG